MLSLLLTASPALAVPIPLGKDDVSLDVGGLLQAQAVVQPAGAPDGESLGFDLFVRRARLMVSAGFGGRYSVTLVTDSPNLGKGGDWSGRILVQDAVASAKVGRGLTLDAGLLLLPFGHQGTQGAGSLGSLDYHSSVFLYPAASTQTWRDVGFLARGLLLSDRIHYRLGVFNGVEGLASTDESGSALPVANPADWPRFAGQIRVNLAGVEDRLFFGGIYFPDHPVVSIGASAVAQPGGVGFDADAETWWAAQGDVYADVPVGAHQELVAQVAVVHYAAGEGALTGGTGGFAELGYRLWQVEPVIGGELFFADAEDADTSTLRAGLNVWIVKHQANVKAEVARVQAAGADVEPTWSGTLQTQLAF